VFVMEVMGRHAGWIAAAAGLAGNGRDEPPHLILFPEVPYDEKAVLTEIQRVVDRVGWCTVVVSEGLRHPDGRFVAEAGGKDAFGHVQLGGVGPTLAGTITAKLGLKTHWAVPDYLQRSARHIASQTDYDHARAVGEAAVALALAGNNAVMPAIRRSSDQPYRWKIEPVSLKRVANHEKKMPKGYIRRDGYGITDSCRRYLAPLIRGEAPLEYGRDGLPKFVKLKNQLVAKKLPDYLP